MEQEKKVNEQATREQEEEKKKEKNEFHNLIKQLPDLPPGKALEIHKRK